MTEMKRKPIPAPTAQNVFPPNLDRDCFDDAPNNPFRPQARTFEPVNAWWLAEAALRAYADEGFARRQFGRAGLGEVAFVSKAGSQCYLAESRDFVMAVFRGTQVPKPGASGTTRGARNRYSASRRRPFARSFASRRRDGSRVCSGSPENPSTTTRRCTTRFAPGTST